MRQHPLPVALVIYLVAGCGDPAVDQPPRLGTVGPAVLAASDPSTDPRASDSSEPSDSAVDPGSPAAVPVRHIEGTVHGFLRLSTAAGQHLAEGDWLQEVVGGIIESRMRFTFRDSSQFDERVDYAQRDVFKMLRYHLIQRGPAFEDDVDISLDQSGAYRVIAISHEDGERKEYVGTMELPPDTYNGMIITIAKNLPLGETRVVHLVAFTPKPRLVELEMTGTRATSTAFGTRTLATARFTLHPTIGGITGFLAKLLGRMPPDSHAWIVTESVPAFVRFEGPLYFGPVWRIDLVGPDRPDGRPEPLP
jgi:hypothetical protein